MVKCVVSGCPNHRVFNRTQKKFFRFPKDPDRVKVWLAALRETDKQDVMEQHFICEDHFLPDHISPQGIRDDAIPIMPPYLDGPLGVISPWSAESSEEEEHWAGVGEEEDDEEDGDEDDDDDDAPAAEPPGRDSHQQQQESLENHSGNEVFSSTLRAGKEIRSSKPCRSDMSLVLLTRRFLELMVAAPGGVLDLRQAVVKLQTRKRRIYDVTNVLDSICLIKKQSVNRIKWIGTSPVSSFLGKKQQKFQSELENLKIVEETLDKLIKTCAQQLFDMTDDTENTGSAYVTHEDVGRIRVFQDQTVIVIKAPEETKLEVPTPKEDSIQIHLKGGKGPIRVVTSDMGRPADGEKTGCFITLEESRITTTTAALHTESSQSAVQSA